MKKFISDEEMSKLESEGKVKKNFISDEEMVTLEAKKEPKEMGFVQSQVQALPIYGAGLAGLAAGIPSGGLAAIPAAALGAGAGQSLKDLINRYAYGEKKGVKEALLDPVKAMAEGATTEMGGQIASKAIGALVKPTARQAEMLAENATGATGVQSAKFEPEAGRELLERKLVRFGDNPAKVAERVKAASGEAGQAIDDALNALDKQGGKVSVKDIVQNLGLKAQELAKDPSQAGIVKKINSIIDDITVTGQPEISLQMGEQTKRGFRKAAGNWMDPEAGQAGKEAYLSYMNAVESAAEKQSPELAKKFMEGKQTYGLLAPIEEAATKRAATLKQSPFGGLLDVAALGGGGLAYGGPAGLAAGIGTAAARKVLAPRISSSLAVTLDQLSKANSQPLQKAVQMTVFQRRLENLNKGK